MGKLVKLLVLLAIVVIAGYAVVKYSGGSDDRQQTDAQKADERPRLEEKYGFTTEQVGP